MRNRAFTFLVLGFVFHAWMFEAPFAYCLMGGDMCCAGWSTEMCGGSEMGSSGGDACDNCWEVVVDDEALTLPLTRLSNPGPTSLDMGPYLDADSLCPPFPSSLRAFSVTARFPSSATARARTTVLRI